MKIPGRSVAEEILRDAERDASGSEIAALLMAARANGSPSEIAEHLGVEVVFGDWAPVTAGEFQKSVGRITVNRKAAVDVETVIAHELGHYCLDVLGREQEERFCDEFAEALTRRCSDLNHADGIK